MESELRPREIQDRIRGGASAEQVAEDAGVELAKIQAFAAPVMAERSHVTSLALASSVRRRGEPLIGRTLREVVTEQLVAHGHASKQLRWDAWRTEDRQWWLGATLDAPATPGRTDAEAVTKDAETVTEDAAAGTEDAAAEPLRRATFRFDLRSRVTTAHDDDARWLLAELSTRHRGGGRSPDPDTEPTEDLEDELALIRALSESRPLSGEQLLSEPDREDSGPLWRPGQVRPDSGRLPRLRPVDRPLPAPQDPRPGGAQPAGGAHREPETVREGGPALDDPYEIIPDDHSDLDVLYDMLGAMQEDSVNIYAGLNEPVASPDARSPDARSSDVASADVPSPNIEDAERRESEPSSPDATGEDEAADGAGRQRRPRLRRRRGETGTASTPPAATDEPEAAAPGVDPDQPSLLEHEQPGATGAENPAPPEPGDAPEEPAPVPKKKSRRRASVPSWDDIVFSAGLNRPGEPKS